MTVTHKTILLQKTALWSQKRRGAACCAPTSDLRHMLNSLRPALRAELCAFQLRAATAAVRPCRGDRLLDFRTTLRAELGPLCVSATIRALGACHRLHHRRAA